MHGDSRDGPCLWPDAEDRRHNQVHHAAGQPAGETAAAVSTVRASARVGVLCAGKCRCRLHRLQLRLDRVQLAQQKRALVLQLVHFGLQRLHVLLAFVTTLLGRQPVSLFLLVATHLTQLQSLSLRCIDFGGRSLRLVM